MNLKEILAEENPEALLWDGFDAALIGVVRRACKPSLALYSASKCVQVLCADGMDYDEAREYLDFNTFCAYMGEHTPCFLEAHPKACGLG